MSGEGNQRTIPYPAITFGTFTPELYLNFARISFSPVREVVEISEKEHNETIEPEPEEEEEHNESIEPELAKEEHDESESERHAEEDNSETIEQEPAEQDHNQSESERAEQDHNESDSENVEEDHVQNQNVENGNVDEEEPPVFNDRRKIYWTFEEEEELKAGVRKYKEKIKKNIPWKKILLDENAKFNRTRTADNLKDKWRRMIEDGSVNPKDY